VENARTLSDTNALDAHTVFFGDRLNNADNEVGSPYNLGIVGEALSQDVVITHDADGDGTADYSLAIVKLDAFFELVITDLATQTYSVLPLSERIDFADGSGYVTFDRVEGKLQAYADEKGPRDQINLTVTENGGVKIESHNKLTGEMEEIWGWEPSDEGDLSASRDVFLGDRTVKIGATSVLSSDEWPLSEDEYLNSGSVYTRLVNFNDTDYISTYDEGTGQTTLHDISEIGDYVTIVTNGDGTKYLVATDENYYVSLSDDGTLEIQAISPLFDAWFSELDNLEEAFIIAETTNTRRLSTAVFDPTMRLGLENGNIHTAAIKFGDSNEYTFTSFAPETHQIWDLTPLLLQSQYLDIDTITGEITAKTDIGNVLSAGAALSLQQTDEGLALYNSDTPEEPLEEFEYSTETKIRSEEIFGNLGDAHGGILRPGESLTPEQSLGKINDSAHLDLYVRAAKITTKDENGNDSTEYSLLMEDRAAGQIFNLTDDMKEFGFNPLTGVWSIDKTKGYQIKLSSEERNTTIQDYVPFEKAYFSHNRERNIVGSSLTGGDLTKDQLLVDDNHRYYFGAIQMTDDTPDDTTDDINEFVLLDSATGKHVRLDNSQYPFLNSSAGTINLKPNQTLEVLDGQLKLQEGKSETVLVDIVGDYTPENAAGTFRAMEEGQAAYIFKATVEQRPDTSANKDEIAKVILKMMEMPSGDENVHNILDRISLSNKAYITQSLIDYEEDIPGSLDTWKRLILVNDQLLYAATTLTRIDPDHAVEFLYDLNVAKIADIYMYMELGAGEEILARLVEDYRISPDDAPPEQADYIYAETPDIGILQEDEEHSQNVAIKLPDGGWHLGEGGFVNISDPKTGEDLGEQPFLVANVKGIDGFLQEGLRRIVPVNNSYGEIMYQLIHSNGDPISDMFVVPPSSLSDPDASWTAFAAQSGDVSIDTTQLLSDAYLDQDAIRFYTDGEVPETTEDLENRRLFGTVNVTLALDGVTLPDQPKITFYEFETRLLDLIKIHNDGGIVTLDDVKQLLFMLDNLSQFEASNLLPEAKAIVIDLINRVDPNRELLSLSPQDHPDGLKYDQALDILAHSVAYRFDRVTGSEETLGQPTTLDALEWMKNTMNNVLNNFRESGVYKELKQWDGMETGDKVSFLSKKLIPQIAKAYGLYDLNAYPEIWYMPLKTHHIMHFRPGRLTINQNALNENDIFTIINNLSNTLISAWYMAQLKEYQINPSSDKVVDFQAVLLPYFSIRVANSYENPNMIKDRTLWHNIMPYFMGEKITQKVGEEFFGKNISFPYYGTDFKPSSITPIVDPTSRTMPY
ncbi:MAG: hypothetical protein AAF228_11610, partial [Pseudomonadota bacterium]